jgi:hypothetical protein
LAVVGAGAGVAAGTGVEQTLSGITFKTFTASSGELRLATLKTLDRMDIKLTQDEETADGWALKGTVTDRDINIELKKLSAAMTRMRVSVVKPDGIFKDASTATEIVLQTAQSLDDVKAASAAANRPTKAAAKGGKRT